MALTEILGSFIGFIVSVPISALVLMLSTKIFKLKDTSFMTALKVSLIIGVAGLFSDLLFIFVLSSFLFFSIIQFVLLNVVLALFLINTFYHTPHKQTLLIWLVWLVLSLTLVFVIFALFFFIGLLFGIGGAIAVA